MAQREGLRKPLRQRGRLLEVPGHPLPDSTGWSGQRHQGLTRRDSIHWQVILTTSLSFLSISHTHKY